MFVGIPNAGFGPVDGLFEVPEVAGMDLGNAYKTDYQERQDE
jgi:hypothetical protein